MEAAADRAVCAKMMAALFYHVSSRNHTQTHRRAGSRDLAVSDQSRSWLSFPAQNFPLERSRDMRGTRGTRETERSEQKKERGY